MHTKRLLNYSEHLTEQPLEEVARRYNVRVFPKVRLADALSINDSGISDRCFNFALRSHFDFVVADAQTWPLFAVEFDGPGHAYSHQRERDLIKDGLCDRFHFPLLRVNSNHVKPQYRGLDILTWFVEQWFLAEEFQKAQEEGAIRPDEPFDPSGFVNLPGHPRIFPLWLSLDIRRSIEKLHMEGRCLDHMPSVFVGRDEEGHYHGIGCLSIDDDSGVYAHSGAKKKAFPVDLFLLVEEILVFEIWEELQGILTGKRKATPLHEVQAKVKQFRSRYRVLSSSSTGEWVS